MVAQQVRRLPDWQLRWEAFVRARRHEPFTWGTNDCAMFAADAVVALTGVDVAPHLRGYSQLRARRLLERKGGLQAAVSSVLGQPVPAARANVGDVVLVPMAGELALAVANGGSAIGPGPDGLIAIPMNTAVMAWKVG